MYALAISLNPVNFDIPSRQKNNPSIRAIMRAAMVVCIVITIPRVSSGKTSLITSAKFINQPYLIGLFGLDILVQDSLIGSVGFYVNEALIKHFEQILVLALEDGKTVG